MLTSLFPLHRPAAVLLAGLLCTAAILPVAHAEDIPTYTIQLKDGTVNTRKIELPAGKRVRINVDNQGTTPAEFESLPMGLELVVAPHSSRSRVVPPKSAGEYKFFDEFHQSTTQGVFVVK